MKTLALYDKEGNALLGGKKSNGGIITSQNQNYFVCVLGREEEEDKNLIETKKEEDAICVVVQTRISKTNEQKTHNFRKLNFKIYVLRFKYILFNVGVLKCQFYCYKKRTIAI